MTNSSNFISLEIFAGAGGLALGIARAGFGHAAVLDWDRNACSTLVRNKADGRMHVRNWKIVECDVRSHDFRQYEGKVDLVSGGPPCQPFSLGGKHLGQDDERNMFPEAIRAIREIRPAAFLFENVRGLLRPSFADYYNYIICQLRFPTLGNQAGEEWSEHFSRLKSLQNGNNGTELQYNVAYKCLNAADFGVPQRRERVFVVGIRTDLGVEFSFPSKSHSQEALLRDQWVTGTYWERHKIPRSKRPKSPPARLRRRIEALHNKVLVDANKPWRTVRDAIGDLPKLEVGQSSKSVMNHYLNPGARTYPGHDGSGWDDPAKALKAGDHGVPGGENTLRFDDMSVRYFSVRECARLQTFPDDWYFEGSWTEAMRQLGNAVPVELGARVASSLFSTVANQAPNATA